MKWKDILVDGEQRRGEFYDGDTVYENNPAGNRTRVGEDGDKVQAFGHRETSINTPELGGLTREHGEISRDAAAELTTNVEHSGRYDTYGRKLSEFKQEDGERTALELARAGLAHPMTTDERVHAAYSAGAMREAMGLPRTTNPITQRMLERAEAAGPLSLPDDYTISTPTPTRKGSTWDRAWDRGVDSFGLTMGGLMEYAGERTGNKDLSERGRAMREHNQRLVTANPADTDLKRVVEGDAGVMDFFIETLGEAAPTLLPELLASIPFGVAGGMVARRAITSVGKKMGAEAAEQVAKDLAKRQVIGASVAGAVPGAISGGLQATGGMQARLKEAGIEDTGNAPLLSGVAGFGVGAAGGAIPIVSFLRGAGIGEGVERTVGEIAKASVPAALKATAGGAGIESSLGAVQNAIDQGLHGAHDEDYDFQLWEMLDSTVRGAIAGGTLAGGASTAGSMYSGIASTMREYNANRDATELAAAEASFVEQERQKDIRVQNTGEETPLNPDAVVPPKATPPEQVGDVVDIGVPERAVAGMGTLHAMDPKDLTDLPSWRYHDLEEQLTVDGKLRPMNEVGDLIEQGTVSAEEVVQFLADSENERTSTVYSAVDTARVNDILKERFEALRQELRTNQTAEESAKQKKAFTEAIAALKGEYRNKKGDLVKEPVGDEKLASRRQNSALRRVLDAYDKDTSDVWGEMGRNLDWKATYNDALDQQKRPKRLVPTMPEQETDGPTPETVSQQQEAEVKKQRKLTADEEALDLGDVATIGNLLIERGEPTLSMIETKLELESNTQKLLTQLEKIVNTVTKPYPDYYGEGGTPSEQVAKLINERNAAMKGLDDKAKEKALTNLFDEVDALAKASILDTYTRMKNRIDVEMDQSKAKYDAVVSDSDAEYGTEASFAETDQDTGSEKTVGDVHDFAFDAPDAPTETDLADMAPAERARYAERHIAYVRDAFNQLNEGGELGDLGPLQAKIEQDIVTQYGVELDSLGEAANRKAPVRVSRGDGGQPDAPTVTGKGSRSNLDTRTLTAANEAKLKEHLAAGDLDKAAGVLRGAGLVPKTVGVDGRAGRANRTLLERALVRGKKWKDTAKNTLIRGLLLDEKGETAHAALDAVELTQQGLRELQILNDDGSYNWGEQQRTGSRPTGKHGDRGQYWYDNDHQLIIAQAFAAGLAESLRADGKQVFTPHTLDLPSDTVVWRSPDNPDATMSWGDVVPKLKQYFRKESTLDIETTTDVEALRWEKSRLEQEIGKYERSLPKEAPEAKVPPREPVNDGKLRLRPDSKAYAILMGNEPAEGAPAPEPTPQRKKVPDTPVEIIEMKARLEGVKSRLAELESSRDADIAGLIDTTDDRVNDFNDGPDRYDREGNRLSEDTPYYSDIEVDPREAKDPEESARLGELAVEGDTNDDHAFATRDRSHERVTESASYTGRRNSKSAREERKERTKRQKANAERFDKAPEQAARIRRLEADIAEVESAMALAKEPLSRSELEQGKARVAEIEAQIAQLLSLRRKLSGPYDKQGELKYPQSEGSPKSDGYSFEGGVLRLNTALVREWSDNHTKRRKVAAETAARIKADLAKLRAEEKELTGKLRSSAYATGMADMELRLNKLKKELAETQKALDKKLDDKPATGNELDQAKKKLESQLVNARKEAAELTQQFYGGEVFGRAYRKLDGLYARLRRVRQIDKDYAERKARIQEQITRANDSLRAEVDKLAQDTGAQAALQKVRDLELELTQVTARLPGDTPSWLPEGAKPMTKAMENANASRLAKRATSPRGKSRLSGVPRFLHSAGDVLFRTAYDRLHTMSPWLASVLSPPVGIDTQGRSFSMAWRIKGNQWSSEIGKLGMKPDELQTAYDRLLEGKTKGPKTQALRKFLDNLGDYVREVDPTFPKDALPMVWNLERVLDNTAVLREVLRDAGVKNPDALVKSLHQGRGVSAMTIFDTGETPSAVMGVKRDLDLLKKVAPRLRELGFLKTDAPEILAGLVDSATRYAEWGRIFGRLTKEGNTEVFDSSAIYRELMDRTLSEGDRAEIRSIVQGITRSNTHNIPRWNRVANSGFFAATALRYLLFSGVASIPELAIAPLRGRRGAVESPKVITKHIAKMAVSDRKGTRELAESLGIVGNQVVKHALQQLMFMDELTVGKTVSRAANTFFHINGQHKITEITRVVSMLEAQDFLYTHGKKALEGDATSARYLRELHIDAEQAVAGRDDHNPVWVDAVHQFVEQSVANPEAGSMPVWMNDPRFAVFASLKKFVFGLFDRVHRSAYHEVKAGKLAPAMGSIAGFVVVASAFSALAEAIREELKYPSMFGMERKNELGWDEKAMKVFSATGLQAHWQLAAGPKAASDYGGNMVLSALNPTLDWFWSDLADPDKRWEAKAADAVPIATQLPWMEGAIRELLRD